MILSCYEVIELISIHPLRAIGSRFLKKIAVPHPSHTLGGQQPHPVCKPVRLLLPLVTISSPPATSMPSGQGASGRPPWQFMSVATMATWGPALSSIQEPQESLACSMGGRGHLAWHLWGRGTGCHIRSLHPGTHAVYPANHTPRSRLWNMETLWAVVLTHRGTRPPGDLWPVWRHSSILSSGSWGTRGYYWHLAGRGPECRCTQDGPSHRD